VFSKQQRNASGIPILKYLALTGESIAIPKMQTVTPRYYCLLLCKHHFITAERTLWRAAAGLWHQLLNNLADSAEAQ